MLLLNPAVRPAAPVSLASLLAVSTGLLASLLFFEFPAHAQNAAPAPNSDPTYQALRNATLGGEAVTVSNFQLHREAATFHLRSGTICFLAPVANKVTGAVFIGDGNLVIDPPRLRACHAETADQGK